MESIFGIFVLVGILYFIWRPAMKGLNPGLPKFGKGKKAKGGGDKIADWTERLVLSVLKGIGRAFCAIVSAPFKRRP